ncbi:MAG: hypothetical protein Q4E89_09275 [Eubacteriales bacterium]|nr:hypothetical protein [Eubacteriales bacterium]
MVKKYRGRLFAMLMTAVMSTASALPLCAAGAAEVKAEEGTETQTAESKEAAESVMIHSWSEKADYEAWYYGEGWEYEYEGAKNSAVAYGQLPIT